jgi:hypothetical protein
MMVRMGVFRRRRGGWQEREEQYSVALSRHHHLARRISFARRYFVVREKEEACRCGV